MVSFGTPHIGVSRCCCLCNVVSENEILREGNISLEVLRDKLKTRVSDLEEEMRRLREELEQSVSNRETRSADDEVIICIVVYFLQFLSFLQHGHIACNAE